jgi:hypothetical protein
MSAKPSEFEEREFEAPLYNQLESGTRLVWSPGQVFEEYIGIDRAIFLADPALWQHFGRTRPFPGAFLHRYDWEFIWRRRMRRRRLPNFRLNLFLQAKRCYHHRKPPKHIRHLIAAGQCWHFEIDTSQQEALSKVAARVGNRAVIAYAAPAFHRLSELYAHTTNGTIVANSTFPLASNLPGHSRWYYSSPGGSGVANADPTPIEGVGLDQLLGSYAAGISDQADGTASTQLAALSAEITTAIREGLPDEHPRKAIYFERVRQAARVAEEIEEVGPSVRSFLEVEAFSETFNLDWYAVSNES